MVSGVGYNPAKRVPGGNYSGVDLRQIVTNLCVMDFGGPGHAVRVVSLHPGVTFAEVQEATGFELIDAVASAKPPCRGLRSWSDHCQPRPAQYPEQCYQGQSPREEGSMTKDANSSNRRQVDRL
jgi:hypothetical protein